MPQESFQEIKKEGGGVRVENLPDWEPKTPQELMGKEITVALKTRGVAYFCGGYVRDTIINRTFGTHFEAKDIDIATDLKPEEARRLLESAGFKTKIAGEKFSTLKVWRDEEANAIDVATFRKEEEYLDGRHPEKVITIRDPAQDAERRDFTINALFFDPVSKEVIDFVGGLEDLRKKILRPVGVAEERFSEDYLRMLRYVRFRTKYGFQFSREVKPIIQQEAENIKKISSERVLSELDSMLKLPKAYQAILDLARLGLLRHILPEVELLRGVEHPKGSYHQEGSVFRHTLEALRSFTRPSYGERIRAVLGLEKNTSSEEVLSLFFKRYGSDIGWSVLFHDLGKRTKQQRKTTVQGERLMFKGHEHDSRDMAGEIMRRLKFSKDKQEKVQWLVEQHLVPRLIPEMRKSRKRALLQHPWIEELLFVVLADELGNLPGKTVGFDGAFTEFKTERARPPEPQELVDGKRLMAELGLKPGPLIGKIKAAIREQQLEEKIRTPEEALEWAKDNLGKIQAEKI